MCMNALVSAICAIALSSVLLAGAPAKEHPAWVPAKVYSIEVGTSQIKDLTRSVGRPKQQTDNENTVAQGGLMYQYDVTWPASGQLWAFVDARSKRVTMLMFKSKVARMDDLVKKFGSEPRSVRYRRQMCDEGKKGFTMCADDVGPVLIYQYPEQGIVVFPGPNGGVNDVYFVAKGLGLLSCECTPAPAN